MRLNHNYLAFLFVGLLLLVGCTEEGRSNRLTKEQIEKENIIKYNIKSVTLTEHKIYVTGDMDITGSLNSFERFDLRGNILEELKYSSEDSIHFFYNYKYSSKGNILEKTKFDSIDSMETKSVFKYDNLDRNIIEEIDFGTDSKIISHKLNHYNQKGQLTQSDEFNNIEGIIKATKRLFKYDDRGNLIEEIYYPSDGVPYTRILYAYNKFDNLSTKTNYIKPNIVYKKTTYQYDENGHLLQEESNEQGDRFRETYTYDKAGKEIECVDLNPDGYSESWTFQYDEKGNKITENYYNSNKEMLATYKYSYEYYK